MDELLGGLQYWHWWLAALLFLILEIFSPGVFFMWLGLAAGVVGLLLLAEPGLSWEWQLGLFGLLSLLSVALGRWWLGRHPIPTDQPTLNRRGEQYVGRVFALEEAIVNGQGRIHVDDTRWKVEGPDCPAGTRVRITGVEGVVLKAEPVEGRDESP